MTMEQRVVLVLLHSAIDVAVKSLGRLLTKPMRGLDDIEKACGGPIMGPDASTGSQWPALGA